MAFKYLLNVALGLGLLASSWGEVPASLRLKTDVIGYQQKNVHQEYDPLVARNLLDSDFESGSMSPWYDESPAYVTWRVEEFSSPSETDYPVPNLSNGTKYVRATRNSDLQSGLAVLRSPLFTAMPGDTITFDFWIRSKRPEGNTMELVWVVGRNETVVATVSKYSTSSNLEWRTISADIPVNAPTEGVLIFYGYCGINYEDAIAIDNIQIENIPPPTSAPSNDLCETYSVTSTGVYITSLNFPQPYPSNTRQCWIFESSYYFFNLNFISFTTESYYDVLTVYPGFNSTQNGLASFAGSYFGTYDYIGYNAYTLVFQSDSSFNNNPGFNIRVYGS